MRKGIEINTNRYSKTWILGFTLNSKRKKKFVNLIAWVVIWKFTKSGNHFFLFQAFSRQKKKKKQTKQNKKKKTSREISPVFQDKKERKKERENDETAISEAWQVIF